MEEIEKKKAELKALESDSIDIKDEPEEDESKEKVEEGSLLDRSTKIAERLENANKETEKLLNKQERVLAETKLQGRSYAGIIQEKKELSEIEYARKVMQGDVTAQELFA